MSSTKRSAKQKKYCTYTSIQTIDNPPETNKIEVTEEQELTLVQKLDLIEKQVKKNSTPQIEFMAYNPSDWVQDNYADDTIANGTTGQGKIQ